MTRPFSEGDDSRQTAPVRHGPGGERDAERRDAEGCDGTGATRLQGVIWGRDEVEYGVKGRDGTGRDEVGKGILGWHGRRDGMRRDETERNGTGQDGIRWDGMKRSGIERNGMGRDQTDEVG